MKNVYLSRAIFYEGGLVIVQLMLVINLTVTAWNNIFTYFSIKY